MHDMKKKEMIVLGVIAAIALGLLLCRTAIFKQETHDGVKVAIYHRNEVVQEFWSDEDAVYTIKGDYGTLDVEVKDGKWRVTNEECPNHVCAQMGWVGPDEFLPITCLPNNVVIAEES